MLNRRNIGQTKEEKVALHSLVLIHRIILLVGLKYLYWIVTGFEISNSIWTGIESTNRREILRQLHGETFPFISALRLF